MSTVISIRVEDDERAELERQAEEVDLPLAKFIRSQALAKEGSIRVEKQVFDWQALAVEMSDRWQKHDNESLTRCLRDAGNKLGYNEGLATRRLKKTD